MPTEGNPGNDLLTGRNCLKSTIREPIKLKSDASVYVQRTKFLPN